MSGQSANMTRSEVIARTKAIEKGPGKTQSGGDKMPPAGMHVGVHKAGK